MARKLDEPMRDLPPFIERVPYSRRDALVPSGLSVWGIINVLKGYDWDVDKMATDVGDEITAEDIQSAVEYYRSHQSEIEAKLDSLREP
jgi:uncharacterized protein (DUF433 family)